MKDNKINLNGVEVSFKNEMIFVDENIIFVEYPEEMHLEEQFDISKKIIDKYKKDLIFRSLTPYGTIDTYVEIGSTIDDIKEGFNYQNRINNIIRNELAQKSFNYKITNFINLLDKDNAKQKFKLFKTRFHFDAKFLASKYKSRIFNKFYSEYRSQKKQLESQKQISDKLFNELYENCCSDKEQQGRKK